MVWMIPPPIRAGDNNLGPWFRGFPIVSAVGRRGSGRLGCWRVSWRAAMGIVLTAAGLLWLLLLWALWVVTVALG